MRILLAAACASLLLGAGTAWAGNHGFPAEWSRAACDAGPAAAAKPGCSAPDLSGYKRVFDEEFDRLPPSIAGRVPGGPWVLNRHAVLHGGEAYGDASAYSVADGVLTMRASTRDGRYREADLETVPSWRNGYFEARIRGPQVNGVHFGFWALNPDNGRTDASGGHGEIDIVEQYGPEDPYDHASTHLQRGNRRDMDSVFNSLFTGRPEQHAVDWHTYGLLATDEAFTIFRDNRPVASIARQPLQRGPLYLLLSLFGNSAHPPDSEVLVDYVRVWTPK